MSRTFKLLIFILVIGLALAGCGGAATPTKTPAAPTLAPVKASDKTVAEGRVVPVRSAALSLTSAGTVAEILAPEGSQVAAGQPILRLRGERQKAALAQAEAELQRAQAALAQIKAGPRPQEVEAAKAAVEAAQAQLDRVQAGARPEEIAAAQAGLEIAQAGLAQVLKGPEEGQLIAARAEAANALAALQQAQAAYDRVKSSPFIGMLPESLALQQATNNYEAAKARLADLQKGPSAPAVAQATAQVKKAEAELNLVKAPARPADVAAAQAELHRAQAQLDLLQAGPRPEQIKIAEADVAAAQAAVDQAKAALDDLELRAPFAGTVATIDVKLGEQVNPGAPIVRLADFSSWLIETTDLTELSVVKVQEGAGVTLTFDAIPDLKLAGKVVKIKAIGEIKQGDMTYTVTVQPAQSDPRLRWNMTATVTL